MLYEYAPKLVWTLFNKQQNIISRNLSQFNIYAQRWQQGCEKSEMSKELKTWWSTSQKKSKKVTKN